MTLFPIYTAKVSNHKHLGTSELLFGLQCCSKLQSDVVYGAHLKVVAIKRCKIGFIAPS